MIDIKPVKIGEKMAIGVRILMPEGPPLIFVRGEKGVLFCGYLNSEAAEKFGLAAAIVRGVSSIEEALNSPVSYCTKKAESLGVRVGVNGIEAVRLLL
jgi:uncharacterized protein YunC (DUF1805 family)